MVNLGSGTYNVRDSEDIQPQFQYPSTTSTSTAVVRNATLPRNENANLSTASTSSKVLRCTVFFLDNTEHEFKIHKNAIGEELLEQVFKHIDLVEKDFFGLQFVCVFDINGSGSRMRWLDTKKSVKKQMTCPPYHLFFRVKFYVSDSTKLVEEYTRYLVYLQLRKDIYCGRLPCTDDEAILLGGYAAQSELGNYDPNEYAENGYPESFQISTYHSSEMMHKIAEMHAKHENMSPGDSECKFLEFAQQLPLYGFDLYEAKDGNESPIIIGVNNEGISIFQKGVKMNAFPWAAIVKLSFKRKQFYVQMKTLDKNRQTVDTVLIFNAISASNCKMLWKSCIEHHTFFRLIAPPPMCVKSIFHLGSRFRYSGRTEYQSVEESRCRPTPQVDRRGAFNRNYSIANHNRGDVDSRCSNIIHNWRQHSSSHSNLSGTPNTSLFSLTTTSQPAATNFAFSFSSRCRHLLSRRRTGGFFRDNALRSKVVQLTDTKYFPKFIGNLLPLHNNNNHSSTVFKVDGDIIMSSEEENFGGNTESTESAAPSISIPIPKPNYAAADTTDSSLLSLRGTDLSEPQPPPPPPSSSSSTSQPLQKSTRERPTSLRSRADIRSSLGHSESPEYVSHLHYPSYANPSSLIGGTGSSSNGCGLEQLLSSSQFSANQLQSALLGSGESNNQYRGYLSTNDKHGPTHIPSYNNNIDDSIRIWQNPNFSTTMIIKDPNAQTCPTACSQHTRSSIIGSAGLNDCRKSMVTDGSLSSHDTGMQTSHFSKTKNVDKNNKPTYTAVTSNGTGLANGQHNNGIISTFSSASHRPSNGSNPNGASSSASSSSSNSNTMLYKTNGRDHARLSAILGGGGDRSIDRHIGALQSTGYATLLTNGSSYDEVSQRSSLGQSPSRQQSNSPTSITNEDIAVVRIVPDVAGRFGFNVSGGYNRGYPVIVSRVVAGSPADKCHPRLNVGDMVLKINGQDISSWSYSLVVSTIRGIRNHPNNPEITLTIKPNVYRYGTVDDFTEPAQNVLPDLPHVAENVPHSDKLAYSLKMLKETLDTGKIVRQFELLYRRNVNMTMKVAQTSANIGKNRYRDVIPYDETRVRLENSPSGDYINANHIRIKIPSSGIVNRYIATQGPLAHTTGDFWWMVWEQSTTTIVMLTTLFEKGRIKCHQYWPSRKETFEFGPLVITNISERLEAYCQYREFIVRNRNVDEERRVTQMQYTSWPDHGIPDNPRHFIDFVNEVRRMRNGSLDPVVVHCSAGIGRTGVLILMETATCLIEANEPVYPLDIVRTMRDQRAMLIQTSDQYTFVCDSILCAYREKMISPLAEYQSRR